MPNVPKAGPEPRYVNKDQFGQRVFRLMDGLDLRQVDLARKAGLTRDDISRYIGGRTFPSRENLTKLAKALNVEPASLLPNIARHAIADHAHPSFELRVSPDNTSVAWLRIDQLVTVTTASKILAILEESRVADGK